MLSCAERRLHLPFPSNLAGGSAGPDPKRSAGGGCSKNICSAPDTEAGICLNSRLPNLTSRLDSPPFQDRWSNSKGYFHLHNVELQIPGLRADVLSVFPGPRKVSFERPPTPG